MSSFSSSFERRALISRIIEAQELGRDAYLTGPDGVRVVHVLPHDSPDVSIQQLEVCDDELFSQVTLSYELPTEGCLSLAGVLLDEGEMFFPQLEKLFGQHPLESITSVGELSQLFESFFGGSGDWRVWYVFVKNLGPQVSDDTVRRLIVPLLEAGELLCVPYAAQALLEQRGWSEDEINSHFCEQARDRRAARAQFLADTGYPVEQVHSTNDLTDAIFPILCKHGGFPAVQSIRTFIRALSTEVDLGRLKRVIEPCLSYFGHHGYLDIVEEFDELYFRYGLNWTYPPYRGPYDDAYGDWNDPVTQFRDVTGRSPQDVRTKEDLVALILAQDLPSGTSTEQNFMRSAMMCYIIEHFVLAQSSFADVVAIQAIINPFVPYVGRFGHEGLRQAIERQGWGAKWTLPAAADCGQREPCGIWREFERDFG